MSRKSKRKHEQRAEPQAADRSSTQVRTSLPEERGWGSDQIRAVETAPSLMRKEEPTFARMVGLVGLFCLVLGSAIQMLSYSGYRGWFNPAFAWILLPPGIAGLLIHASIDRDLQVRRLYGLLGGILLALGAILCISAAWNFLVAMVGSKSVPVTPEKIPILYGYGLLCLFDSLFMLVFFARHETEEEWRSRAITTLGGTGAALALIGFVGGVIWSDFLAPNGLIIALLGLCYLCGFILLRDNLDPIRYRLTQVIGLVGLFVFLLGLGRSIFPPLFYAWHWIPDSPEPYLVPHGLLLMLAGSLFGGFGIALSSDRPVVVLTRRELAAFFYSPIAYLVLFGLTAIGAALFGFFIIQLISATNQGVILQEPIVRDYILSIAPVICVVFVVPVLTMGLLSDEHRSGTLEVLLTAPVSEWAVVLSKFFAAWLFYQLVWLPWGLFLIALRVENGQPFEYRPLLGFFLVQMCTGAGFIAMGVFFSSLTRQWIIAGVLSFAAMLMSVMAYLLQWVLQRLQSGPVVSPSPWPTVLAHVNFIDVWVAALGGMLVPRALLFHLCVAVFFLFLTVKVLESRKWR